MTTHPASPADCRRVADRLAVLLILAEGPRSPGEMHAAIGLGPGGLSSTSHRLLSLKQVGLVEAMGGGTVGRTYAITDESRAMADRLARFIAGIGQVR